VKSDRLEAQIGGWRRSATRFGGSSTSTSPAGRGTSPDEAARAARISRSLAGFHLDRLVEQGLLETSFRRLSGRTGPGAGRPAKLYRRSSRQVEVSLPHREYELAARILATAVDAGDAPGPGKPWSGRRGASASTSGRMRARGRAHGPAETPARRDGGRARGPGLRARIRERGAAGCATVRSTRSWRSTASSSAA
jgi:hypothetical protein